MIYGVPNPDKVEAWGRLHNPTCLSLGDTPLYDAALHLAGRHVDVEIFQRDMANPAARRRLWLQPTHLVWRPFPDREDQWYGHSCHLWDDFGLEWCQEAHVEVTPVEEDAITYVGAIVQGVSLEPVFRARGGERRGVHPKVKGWDAVEVWVWTVDGFERDTCLPRQLMDTFRKMGVVGRTKTIAVLRRGVPE